MHMHMHILHLHTHVHTHVHVACACTTNTTGAITLAVPGAQITFGRPSMTERGRAGKRVETNGEVALSHCLGLSHRARRLAARFEASSYQCMHIGVIAIWTDAVSSAHATCE